jgi:hypothetical protein
LPAFIKFEAFSAYIACAVLIPFDHVSCAVETGTSFTVRASDRIDVTEVIFRCWLAPVGDVSVEELLACFFGAAL